MRGTGRVSSKWKRWLLVGMLIPSSPLWAINQEHDCNNMAAGAQAVGYQPRHSWRDPSVMARVVQSSIDWYDQHAWDEEFGVYRSAVDNNGKPDAENGDKVFILATSRTLYGLAHAPNPNERTRERAQRIKNFILTRMVHPTKTFFLEQVDLNVLRRHPNMTAQDWAELETELPAMTAPLTVNYQAYGLNGLVALYKQSPNDPELLRAIHRLFDAFVKNFRDERGEWKGFFDSNTGDGHNVKSYNSTVYVATSFLFDLYYADPSRRAEYGRYLAELSNIVANHFVDPKTGWIIENFTGEWADPETWRGWNGADGDKVGSVGHNFQAAWMLMRASLLDGVPPRARDLYLNKAREILTSMLGKPVIDWKNGGIFDAFIRNKDVVKWNKNKSWWQQGEAIMALTLAISLNVLPPHIASAARDLIFDFFVDHFPDGTNGGVFPTVTEDGTIVLGDYKIGPGTGIYHEAELMLVLAKYSKGDLRH